MTFEAQLKNLELRLTMAIQHAVQAQADLDTIRAKADLGPARPVFHLTPPPGAETDTRSNGVAEMKLRQALKFRPAQSEPAIPNSLAHLSADQLREILGTIRGDPPHDRHAGVAAYIRMKAAEREAAAAAPPAPVMATADAILRAAAIAKGELVELPPVGSEARAILEAGAKRRSETLDGKPL